MGLRPVPSASTQVARMPTLLRRFARNTLTIWLHGNALGRWPVFWNYCRVEMKRIILAGWLGRSIQHERLWGQELSFYDYNAFALGFEEIYLTESYRCSPEPKSPRIIDCGANVGISVAYFLTIYPGARITAFEADPRTFAMLAANRERNGWNVELVNRAVHNSRGPVPFYSYAEEPGSVVASVQNAPTARPYTAQNTVQAVRLSDYISGTVDLLKMDVEGSEHAVLEDLAERGVLGRIRRIVLEYHHHMNPAEDRLGEFLSTIEKAGFGYDFRAAAPSPIPIMNPHNFVMVVYGKPA